MFHSLVSWKSGVATWGSKWNLRPRFLLVNSNFGQISLSSWWNPYFCWWDLDSRVKSKICWNPVFFACKNPVSSWSTPQFVADEIPFHARPSCIFRPACRRQCLWRGGGWPSRGRRRHFRRVGSSVGWQGDLELLHQDLRDEGQNPDVCRLEFDWKNKIVGGFFGNYRGFPASVIEILVEGVFFPSKSRFCCPKFGGGLLPSNLSE